MIFTLFSISSTNVVRARTNADRPTIKVGGLGPLAITPGNDMKNGLELALAEINVDGVEITVKICDTDAETQTPAISTLLLVEIF